MANFSRRLTQQTSQNTKTYMGYSDYLRLGVMKPLTVRLPASTHAKVDELFERCNGVWQSKQELLFEMIESAIADYIESQNDPEIEAEIFQEIARKGLQPHSPRRSPQFQDYMGYKIKLLINEIKSKGKWHAFVYIEKKGFGISPGGDFSNGRTGETAEEAAEIGWKIGRDYIDKHLLDS